jgi:flagellar biosynthesis/type III secretory pathway ATPase
MIRIGAYQKGLDPVLDRAIAAVPAINSFLCQKPDEHPSYNDVVRELLAIPE